MSTKTPKAPKGTATTLPPATKPIPQEVSIPASSFQRYPHNRVPKEDAIAEMADSIRENGQLQPITCRSIGRVANGHPEQYEIIFGETRWLGCAKIHADFPVRAYVLDADDKEVAKIHAIENFQRRDLDDLEQGQSMKNMLSNGWTMEEVMNHLSREKDYVYVRIGLLKLPDEAKQALRDRSISLLTANLIVSLPPEQQTGALKACIEPKYASEPLSSREALAMLRRDFVEPAKKAKEWEDRRAELEAEYPGAKWLAYQEAKDFRGENQQHIASAKNVPSWGFLTEAAKERIKEPTVELPTWGELAAKHGITGTIAFEGHWSENVVVFIHTAPVIAAERASDPQSYFKDPAAKDEDESDEEKEKRKAELEREAALETAIEGEQLRAIEHVLSRKAIPKTATRKLLEAALVAYVESSYEEWDHMEKLFPGVDRDAEYSIIRDHCLAEFAKQIKAKDVDPFEVFGRVIVAHEFAKASYHDHATHQGSLPDLVFATGAFKRTEYPALNERFPEKPAEESAPAAEGEAQPEGASAVE